jgi:hypothetical protein
MDPLPVALWALPGHVISSTAIGSCSAGFSAAPPVIYLSMYHAVTCSFSAFNAKLQSGRSLHTLRAKAWIGSQWHGTMNASCSLLLPLIAPIVLSVVRLGPSFLLPGEKDAQ